MSDLKKRLEEERDRHVAGYPGPRRDVAELLDDALSALTHPAPTHNDGRGEAAAWQHRHRFRREGDLNADWLEWTEWTDGRAPPELKARATLGYFEYEERPLFPTHTSGEVTETQLLTEMGKHLNWELDWGSLDPSDETSECGWRVYKVTGGRNDREWTLMGVGDTPAAALEAALQGDAS